jgi:tetratricopeptide (TPR) repeat protein
VANDNRYEARTVINDMTRKFGKRPELYNELCRLYSIDGFIEQALQTCHQAIQLSPQNAKNFVYMANSYKDQKEPEKAGKLLSNAAKRFPKSEFLQVAAGDFYQGQKNHPVAARYYEKAVALNPKMAEAQIGLARSLTETGRFKEAYPHFFAACRADSQTLPEFQEALVKVRQSGNSDLESQFSRGIYSCKQ